MADTKISEFASATSIAAIDTVPIVQSGTNKKMTVGQIKTFVFTPTVIPVNAATVPVSASGIVSVIGNCVLPVATVDGTELKIISVGAGKIQGTNILPNDGYTFAASGAALNIIWLSNKWNVLTASAEMVPGV